MNITIPQYLHSSGSQIINCNCSDSLFASLTDLLFSIGTASVFDSEAVLMENNTSAKEAIIAEAVFTIHYLAASAIVPDQSVHHCGIAGYIFRPSSKNVCVCVGGGWGGGGCDLNLWQELIQWWKQVSVKIWDSWVSLRCPSSVSLAERDVSRNTLFVD